MCYYDSGVKHQLPILTLPFAIGVDIAPAPFSFVVGTEIKDPPGSEYYPEDIPCQALTHGIKMVIFAGK